MRLISAWVIVPLLSLPPALHAQQLRIGSRIGATSSTQTPTYGYYGRLRGATAGVDATLELNSWIAFESGFFYVRKGTQASGFEMRLDYLETPFLVRIGSPLGASSLRPFLTAGTALAEEIRCAGYTERFFLTSVGSSNPPGTAPLDCDSRRKLQGDFGLVFGGGVSIDEGPMQFTAEIRRTRGSDIGGFACCEVRNDATSYLFGISHRLSRR